MEEKEDKLTLYERQLPNSLHDAPTFAIKKVHRSTSRGVTSSAAVTRINTIVELGEMMAVFGVAERRRSDLAAFDEHHTRVEVPEVFIARKDWRYKAVSAVSLILDAPAQSKPKSPTS